MKILVLHASVEGQTAKIARFVRQVAEAAGHEARMVDADDERAALGLGEVDAAILAAPVHERRHPAAFEATLIARRAEFAAIPTLMLSVSLSAAFEEGMEDAQDYLEEMKLRTGFEPRKEMLVAGAVRTGKYDYFATQVVRFVVLRGRDYDPGEGDHEFTDWEALRSGVTAFLEETAGDRPRSAG